MLEEHTSKTKHVFVQRRRVVRKPTKKQSAKAKGRSVFHYWSNKTFLSFPRNNWTDDWTIGTPMGRANFCAIVPLVAGFGRTDGTHLGCVSIRCSVRCSGGWSKVFYSSQCLQWMVVLFFSLTAVARIRQALQTNKIDEAVALFRASRYVVSNSWRWEWTVSFCREVWRSEPTFGYEDIGAEEEFNLLREIYMTSNMDGRICVFSG